jgi:hypothetical protein
MAAKPVKFACIDAGHPNLLCLGWKPRDTRGRAARQGRMDDNWLKVHGRAACNRGRWEFVDACLTEHEAAELVGWLSQRPWPQESEIRFTEPCLGFKAQGIGPDSLRFAACFRGEIAPPWIGGDEEAVWHTGWTIEYAVTDQQLRAFAAELHGLLIGDR